jgi:hemolysin III
LFGALLSLVGLAWLVHLTRHDLHRLVPSLIFGMSMFVVYVCSTLLHLIKCEDKYERWLNRLDHAVIYMLIAGTYTPLVYHGLQGHWRWGVLGTVWALALFGVLYKLLMHTHDTLWSNLFYIAVGVSGVLLAGPDLLQHVPMHILGLMIGGGMIYLAGVIVFATRAPNLHPSFGFHELWHLFVMAGSGLHFAGVVLYLA